MAKQTINLGSGPDSYTGDSLRVAFSKINDNFSDLYTGNAAGNIRASGNIIANVSLRTDGSILGQTLEIIGNAVVLGTMSANNYTYANGVSLGDFSNTTINTSGNISGNNLTANNYYGGNVYADYGDFVDLLVSGNLTVNGNTTFIDVSRTEIKDPLIELGGNAAGTALTSNDNKDRGLILHYYNGAARDAFIGWDSSSSEIRIASNAIVVNNEVLLWDTYANVRAGHFIGNGSQLTGILSYANSNVVAYAETGWAGNIIPNANAVYSLGNVTNQWANLWVANNTIYIGGVPLGIGAGNVLTINGEPLLSNSSTTSISTTGNVSANVVDAVSLVGTSANLGDLRIQGSYIYKEGGVDDRITITPDIEGWAYLQLPDDANASIIDTRLHNDVGNVEIASNGNNWLFKNDGTLETSSNLRISPMGLFAPVSGTMIYQGTDEVLTIVSDGISGSSAQTLVGWYANVAAGSGNLAVIGMNALGSESVGITTGNTDSQLYNWVFDKYGQLTLPSTIGQLHYISEGDGGAQFVSEGTVSIGANANTGNASSWLFGTDGNLTISGNINYSNGVSILDGLAVSGNINVELSEINFVANSSGDGNGYSTLELIPDNTLKANDQYLVIDPTGGEPGHIHLRAGGTQDASAADLYLGGELTFVRVSDTSDTVTIRTTQAGDPAISKQWQFTPNGDLYFPSTTADLFIGEDEPGLTLKSSLGIAFVTNLDANSQAWIFDSDGNLTVPGTIIFSGSPAVLTLSTLTTTDVNASGNISANYFIGNGSQLTGLPASYTNANVTTLLANLGANVISGTANLTTTANISGNYILGNAAFMTGIPASYGNTNVAAFLAAYGSNSISTTGNITAGNISGNINITGNVTGTSSNVDLVAGVYTWSFNNTGNLVLPGNTFAVTYANGTTVSLGGAGTSYTDANVTTLLASLGSNVISSTGNITTTANISGGNLITTGTFQSANITATGNITSGNGFNLVLGNAASALRQAGSNANVQLAGSINLIPDTAASATNGVLIGGSGYLLGPNGSRVLTLNYNSVGGALGIQTNLVVGTTAAGGTANITGNVTTGVNTVLAGVTNTILSNTVAAFSANVNNYSQITFQNKNTGADATADYILTADNGNDTTNYGDFGIINSGYDNATPTNSLGNIVYAADTYLYAQGNSSATSQSGGNLVIGTATANKSVKIFAGGNTNNSLVANISNVGINVTGTLTVSGNITGSTPNVNLVAGSYTTTFDNTGNVTIPGNVVVNGSLGIRTPNLPAFRIYGAGSSNWSTANTNFKGSGIVVDYNQGSHFNSNTGVFTTPIAGLYNITLNARVGNNNGSNQIMVIKNGQTSAGNVAVMWECDTNTGTATHFGVSTVMKLAVGDTLTANITVGNVQFDANDSWTVTYLG